MAVVVLAAIVLPLRGGPALAAVPPSPQARDRSAVAVQGALHSALQHLVFSHGAAWLHDGAEGLDGGVPQLRLLLSDGPVDPERLQGLLPELRLQEAARSGALRGVVVTFDPANPDHLEITPLALPGADGPGAISSLSITRSGGPGPGAFDTFSYRPERLQAAFTYNRESSFPAAPSDIRSLTFQVDLPVQREPAVTARVRGGAAVRATPQGKLALARARAWATLDSKGLAQLRVESPATLPSLPPGTSEGELLQMLRGLASDQERALGGDDLVLTERGDRAVLVMGEAEGLRSWIPFRRRNGSWQFD